MLRVEDLTNERAIIWRRLDRPGHEAVRLFFTEPRWHLVGTAIFLDPQLPCSLNYKIECDSNWRTVSARVEGWRGTVPIGIDISVGGNGRWSMNGNDCPQVAGCIDIDLNFSPLTNLLPIRRLELNVGQEAPVRAAWLRFPSFELELLEQTYRRTGQTSYRYESAGGEFVSELEVDDFGLVVNYPGLWQVEE